MNKLFLKRESEISWMNIAHQIVEDIHNEMVNYPFRNTGVKFNTPLHSPNPLLPSQKNMGIVRYTQLRSCVMFIWLFE